jgi:hypothetical protein
MNKLVQLVFLVFDFLTLIVRSLKKTKEEKIEDASKKAKELHDEIKDSGRPKWN